MTERRAARRLALTCALALLPLPAAAEWHLTPLVGFTFKGGTSIADFDLSDSEGPTAERHWLWGGAVTLIGAGPVGVESLFLHVPGFFQRGDGSALPSVPGLFPDPVRSHTLAWMGNIVVAAPRGWNEYGLRPFVSAGLGVLNATIDYDPELPFPLPVRENLAGFNVGGGAVGFLTERVGLRFDLRYVGTLRREEELSNEPIAFGDVRLHYWTAAIGVVFRP